MDKKFEIGNGTAGLLNAYHDVKVFGEDLDGICLELEKRGFAGSMQTVCWKGNIRTECTA